MMQVTFNRIYWLISLLLCMMVIIRSALVPFSHDEVATFYFYIQPGSFVPFYSHVDANGHFLTNALGWICFKLFGSSPFVLRLPSTAAFILLCYAVYRFLPLLQTTVMRSVFAAGFLLLYSFVAYFSLCRGYALSMAFLLLALYYFFTGVKMVRFSPFLKFVLCAQLALSANLTLLIVVGLCTVTLVVFQWKEKQLFSTRTLLLHVLNLALLTFWAIYGFYLQEKGALYYGAGSGYWATTFRTLIDNLFGSSLSLEILLGLTCITIFILWLKQSARYGLVFFRQRPSVAFVLFVSLVAGFYLLKVFMGVNYPEDRTGLFFYVFFLISFCFVVDNVVKPRFHLVFAQVIIVLIVFSALRVDLRNHPWSIYETIPPHFYDLLVREQKNTAKPVTIAGHRIRELNYGFLNYRSPYKLNHMTSPEALQMNCDYAVAVKADKGWYQQYYTEMSVDDQWGFVLLKRKKPINRQMFLENSKPLLFEGNAEYYNCLEIRDTVFSSSHPLQADVTFEISECPMPFKGWLVMQVDPVNDEEEAVFVRIPLDLIYYNWKQASQISLSLVTGNVPLQVKRVVLYFWNINSAELKIKVSGCSLSRLQGEGVTVISQAKL